MVHHPKTNAEYDALKVNGKLIVVDFSYVPAFLWFPLFSALTRASQCRVVRSVQVHCPGECLSGGYGSRC